jgi:hypothetical protein
MTQRVLGPTGSPRRRHSLLAAVLVAFCCMFAIGVASSSANGPDCNPGPTLAGSNFEIDTDANLKKDGAVGTGCIDWKVVSHSYNPDAPSGSGDDSFGQGTAEDTAAPTIVSGSIPPNKSDLKEFGLYQETTSAGKFLHLYWSRVQDPNGTTNMDFELNKLACDGTATNCADNSTNGSKTPVYVTPKRSSGDKLITYDLSKGGTVPAISIREWNGAAWGSPTVISDGGTNLAKGSVNTSTIPETESADNLGELTPFTFGEASIDFAALFGENDCDTFGSVYLKSRSSDSFTSEVKDFVPPQDVFISNCASISTSATASITIGGSISDTASLSDVTGSAGGTITFRLWGPSATADCTGTPIFTSTKNVSGEDNYTSGSYTPTAVGKYWWIASYSGDANNSPATGKCGDTGEGSVVNKASPSIVTNATASITIGSTITDSATLSNATSDASGTITFRLFSDASCSTEITLTTAQSQASVSGNGTYSPSAAYTPTAVGTFYWIASYSGDAKNNSISGSCGDANESSVVNKADSTIATTQRLYPNDSATVTPSSATGNVTFELFGPYAVGDTINCLAGKLVFSQTVALSGGTASTTNYPGVGGVTAFAATVSGTYAWRVSYGGSGTLNGRVSTCGSEKVVITITNDSGPGSSS